MKNTIETKIAELKTEYQELTAELHADENISDAKDARIRKARREVNAEIETLTALYNSSTDPDFREQISNKAIELVSNAAEEISEIEAETELAADTVANENDGYDESAFDFLPNFEDDELRDYLYDFDEKMQLSEDKYETYTPEKTAATVTENSEEKITIDAVIADAKDFIATNLDARTEKVFKLCFGIHVALHFYLNNLKSKHFAEVHKIESELRNFKTASNKFYRAYLTASDGYIDSEEMTALYKHIYDCTETPYTNAVWAETREIANQILDNLGEETLMRELAKVTDEFGFDRDLLNQSDNCDFKPFNLDDPEPTPEPERTKIHVENESEDDFELYPIDVAIYHGGDILTEDELEDYAAQFREAITVNGNFGTVEIGESYLSVWGNTGGDNKTIWKLIGDLCWRGDCALEGYGSKETDYELREMPGEEIDAMLERMGIDNDPPALVIGNEPADPNEPLIAANIREAAIKFGEKFFGKDESMSKFESEDERNARIDGYLNTAYELEGMATELEIICDNFDEDSEIETDWHVASRISFYVDHVKRGIEGLREMIDWYKQQADFAESKAE